MKNRIHCWRGDYYANRMLLFSIPYFILNLLDLITTRIALASSEILYELNPLYYHPYSVPLKIFAPILLLLFYLALYHFNTSEQGRRNVGKYGSCCIIGLTILYSIVCANNVCQCVLSS